MIDTRSVYSTTRLDKFILDFKDNKAVSSALNRIKFFHKNVSKGYKFMFEDRPITHIYCFNFMFSDIDNEYIVNEINRSD